jgi:hypothetical protein
MFMSTKTGALLKEANMPIGFTRLLLFVGAIVTVVTPAHAEITAEQVQQAMKRGVLYLKSQQMKPNGNWPERAGFRGGLTALCTLALLECGEPVDSPAIQKALSYLRSLDELRDTYSVSTQIMALAAAEPRKDLLLIRRRAEWLERAQIPGGDRAGAWSYFAKHTGGDNSNSQFAVLGLHEAELAGVEIGEQTWERTLKYWKSCQRPDGAFGYYKDVEGVSTTASTGSMTCAGIAALIIASGKMHEGDARVVGGTVKCCCEQQDNSAVVRAFQWLGNHFSVLVNPGPMGGSRVRDFSLSGRLYYLYGMERVGRLTGRRFIGRHDWYREGAEALVDEQDKDFGSWLGTGHGEDNKLIATSFALLFLAKGRRPVVIAKLKHGYGNDWNRHRSALHNLTRNVEQRWRRSDPQWRQRLAWQNIDVTAATLEDLLETPVLFISGSKGLDLAREHKENLKDYVNQGGFLFAETCCSGGDFDAKFRALMKELFPNSALRLLPADHAIWYAEQKVDPKYVRPLYGIDACCRTSVVYCPHDLSCYWELDRGQRKTGYPQAIQDEINACLAIGANVLTYATNRRIKDKLDRPRISRQAAGQKEPERAVLVIPKITHGGGSNDATNALPNLLETINKQIEIRLSAEQRLLSLSDAKLYDYPIAFIHGRRDFRLTPIERKALGTYLKRGGFLFGDAICASSQFAAAFRREVKAALPEAKFVRIPAVHPLFTKEFRGYDTSTVTLRDPQVRTEEDPLKAKLSKVKPFLEGVEIDGRLAVVFSPYDISCAMENHASMECKGYIRADAARLCVNIVLFALLQ